MSENSRPVNRRDMLNGIAAGTAVVGGFSGSSSASPTEPEDRFELSWHERAMELKRFQDTEYTRETFASRTKSLREELVEEGHIDSPELNIEEVELHSGPGWDDFTTLSGSVVWNEKLERAAVFLQKRVDAGDYHIKLTVNVTAEKETALLLNREEGQLERLTTSGGESAALTTSSDDACGDGDDCWEGCVKQDYYCDYCCGNWIDPNYRISFACFDSDGSIDTTTCCCSCCDWAYTCCNNCGDDEDDPGCTGCC